MSTNKCAKQTVWPGGIIERGKVISVSQEGYAIASMDRDGIETPPLKPIDNRTYTEGASVIFIFFKDGTGKILCGM